MSRVPAGGALWSAVRQMAGSLSPALITSSALYSSSSSSSQPSQASFFPSPLSLSLSLFFNLIMESSAPPEQAAMLAAGGGIIFSEHVSVSRYRSTCGVNLAWRSGAILLCAREYEMLLSGAEVQKHGIWGQKIAACKGDFFDTPQLILLWRGQLKSSAYHLLYSIHLSTLTLPSLHLCFMLVI